MGIKQRNLDEVVLYLTKPGSIAAANNVDAKSVPFDGAIVAVHATSGVIGVDGTGSPTADIAVDVNKNGTTVISTKMTWAHATLAKTPSSYGSFVGAPIAVSEGDVLSIDFDTVLNGTSPTQPLNFVLAITIGRRNIPSAIRTGSIGVAG